MLTATIVQLRDILVRITGDPEVARMDDDVSLFADGYGLDSLSGVRLLNEVKTRYGVDVAAEDLNLDALASIGALATFIVDRAGAPEGTELRGPRPPLRA